MKKSVFAQMGGTYRQESVDCYHKSPKWSSNGSMPSTKVPAPDVDRHECVNRTDAANPRCGGISIESAVIAAYN